MPFAARPDIGIEDDRDRDKHLGRGPLQLQMRRHECAQAHAHGDSAHHEREDVSAAVGLREIGRQPVGPAIGVFKHSDRRVDIVRDRASLAKLLPLVAVHLVGVGHVEVARLETANARGASAAVNIRAAPGTGSAAP